MVVFHAGNVGPAELDFLWQVHHNTEIICYFFYGGGRESVIIVRLLRKTRGTK